MQRCSTLGQPRRPGAVVVFAVLHVCLTASTWGQASAAPWVLRDFQHCRGLRLKSIRSEASGLTYSPVTNSVWVVTRRPMILGEYSMTGKLLRTIATNSARLRDPEGITWMYDYVFAISSERGISSSRESMVSIVDASPWRDRVELIKTIAMRIPQKGNQGLESVTYDVTENVLIAGQEMHPMQMWKIDPDSGRAEKCYNDAERTRDLRDFAGLYKRPGDDGIYVLSEPNERVFKLDATGRRIRGEDLSVRGKMPEGLTFTPDGKVMVIVGEPNEMFFYSSTGDCDYTPDHGLQITSNVKPHFPLTTGQASGSGSDSEEDNLSSVQLASYTEGYCNWEQCKGGAQGVTWCRQDAHRCVGACGGWWCSADKELAPITPDNYSKPADPPPPPADKNWFENPESGTCRWQTSCDSGAISMKWCQTGAGNCRKCRGTWCPKKGLDVEPLTPESFPHSSDTKDEPESADGFSALFDIVLDTPGSLHDTNVSMLRQALAREIFGAAEAAVLIEALDTIDIVSRRRLSSDSRHSYVSFVVMAETPEHASYLTKKLQDKIQSGSLHSTLNDLGLAELESVEMGDSIIVHSQTAPQHYPTVKSRDSDSDAPVIIVYLSEDRYSWMTIATFVCSLLALALSALAVGYLILRRKRSCAVQCLSEALSDAQDEQNLPDIPGMVNVTLKQVKVVKGDGKMAPGCKTDAADVGLASPDQGQKNSDGTEAVSAVHMPGQLPTW